MLLCLFHMVRLCPLHIFFTDWKIFICLSKVGSYYVLTLSPHLSLSVRPIVCLFCPLPSRVRSIFPKQIEWILCNFGQMFTMQRKSVELITKPCPMNVRVTIQGQKLNGNVLCPVYNFKTFWDSFMKRCITKTRLYSFDPLKPNFYTVKLGFTGVYIKFLLKNIDCDTR